MTTNRTEYNTKYQRKRRAAASAAGAPLPHTGKSGPGGKDTTQAERQRRYRARKKAREAENSC